jgi:hypothetical protein
MSYSHLLMLISLIVDIHDVIYLGDNMIYHCHQRICLVIDERRSERADAQRENQKFALDRIFIIELSHHNAALVSPSMTAISGREFTEEWSCTIDESTHIITQYIES